ncbi:MAG: radical SAM protein [Nitrosomonas sp.]|nr:radical SAM protein [Nitrosomonas sp.]MCW5607775.1 radical SAM protein [Nitrosomonas sp.]
MQQTPNLLNTTDHSRDTAGLTYVYPVISRRAGGVSIGINLNPNNACNWRCIYCQVPDLKRGAAPPVDLHKLEAELREFLTELICGRFMQEQVPPEARHIRDIALSGNGEPTSAKAFEQVIELIGRVKQDFPLPDNLKLVLITNGSFIDRPYVLAGLERMAKLNGEIWFKLDSATSEGRLRINNTRMSLKRVRDNLKLAVSYCPTWLQTCVFSQDGQPPSEKEAAAYLAFIEDLMASGIILSGVLLYGIERISHQPESATLAKVDESWFIAFADKITARGLHVKQSL